MNLRTMIIKMEDIHILHLFYIEQRDFHRKQPQRDRSCPKSLKDNKLLFTKSEDIKQGTILLKDLRLS